MKDWDFGHGFTRMDTDFRMIGFRPSVFIRVTIKKTKEDPMPEAARSTVQHDNARTRVTLWEFAPGAATGWHRHEMDYVIVPLTTGTLTLIEEGGVENSAELTAGVSYFRETGVEHDVINANDFDFAFLEVEFK